MTHNYIMFSKYKEAMRTLLVLASITVACQTAQPSGMGATFSGEAALERIEQQLAFGPRYPGSSGHELTQAWLVEQLSLLGWGVELQRFEYRGLTLTNIIARQNQRTDFPKILFGAHYDTRQFADRDPQDPTQPVPGANDGASGVAVLLELARTFVKTPSTDVILVFFDGEDQGRINEWDWAVGSQYFVDHLEDEISAAIIVDMVGDRDLSLPYERSSDPDLVRAIWATAQGLGYPSFENDPGPNLIDDHIPFLLRGIPAVDIIDFEYPYWHTSADRIDKVSAESLLQVGATLAFWLKNTTDGAINPTQ